VTPGSESSWQELSPDAFYAQLVERNAGLIAPSSQQRLARATILVAGCGSTGGASIEPLVRLGVQRLLLADVGSYELNNLNRQAAFLAELGQNKAQACAARALRINPHVSVTYYPEGITESNAADLARSADVVIDGVDVTTRAGWRAKFLTHQAAIAAGVPVITGYDMAGSQYIRFYDYARHSLPFAGRLTQADINTCSSLRLLRKVLPLRYVPLEMLDEVRPRIHEPDRSVPQLVYASMLFGALASRMVLDTLDGRPVRRHTCIDIHQAVAPRRSGIMKMSRKPWALITGLRELARAAPGTVTSAGADRGASG
jgi:tRNA threonylcarbamoyladenosine dehydratase